MRVHCITTVEDKAEATMALKLLLSLFLFVSLTAQLSHGADRLSRRSFPAGFVFGTSSSAYQYEGAAFSYGKGPNIWDTYTHEHPERIADGSNGDVADDQYHLYRKDVRIMRDLGVDAYRFSISWARVLPKGKLSGGVNMKGINHYNRLIDRLIKNGLKPYVTIFHWDVPQGLEDDYGGFLSPKSVNDFKDFAELCFKHFGDRVKHWMTLNEPWSFSSAGYAYGASAPGRCSAWMNLNCTGGDSATEPYIVAHHLLLAHAYAVRLYNTKYKAIQKGVIGIALNSYWLEPLTNSTQDVAAAFRYLDFMYGWFMDPLTNGYYPRTMRELVKDRLPTFSPAESRLVKGSFDFIGLNYYTGNYAAYEPTANGVNASYLTDPLTSLTGERNGVLIGPQPFPGWLYVYPQGLENLLLYTKTKYGNPPLYITENGMYEFNNLTLPLSEQLSDPYRISYYIAHLNKTLIAIKEGVNLKGYFAWSLLDNFEWGSGYSVRFGIYYVDYENGLKRYPKKSATWFKNFLTK